MARAEQATAKVEEVRTYVEAFLGDGAENNWTVWRDSFSSFTPILDFIHALSYVYAAAQAGCTKTAGWLRYRAWIAWVWQGRVDRVLEALRTLQAEWGEPKEEDKETHPRTVVARTLTYLENNRSRMRYDEYRRPVLPIASSYVESAVKQFNPRAKGHGKVLDRGRRRGDSPVGRRLPERKRASGGLLGTPASTKPRVSAPTGG